MYQKRLKERVTTPQISNCIPSLISINGVRYFLNNILSYGDIVFCNLEVSLTKPFTIIFCKIDNALCPMCQKIITPNPDIFMKQPISKGTAKIQFISSIYTSEFRCTIVWDDHNQPLRKPARRNPDTIYGHARINRQIKPER